jgi:hypothetical protein
MSKPMVQDIKMIKRDNEAMHESAARKILDDYKNQSRGPMRPNGRKYSRLALWSIAAACVLVLVFAVSLLFARASVSITPKVEDITLDNASYTASATPAPGEIGFQLASFSGEEDASIPAEQTGQQVDQKAKGTVILYNEYSTAAQKLIINTRLATPDGKVYRLDTAVSIPGYTMKAGVKIPGSVKTTVTADQPGEASNIGLSDFTVPGLKGEPQYEKIYARSDAPISGGATGIVNSVSADTYSRSQADLDAKLKDKLVAELRAQIPAGYVLFDNAATFTVDPASKIANLYSTTTSIPVVEKGTVTAVLVDETALSAKMAQDTISQYDGAPVSIPDMSTLNFTLTNTEPVTSETKQITFNVSGNAKVVWTFDEGKLTRDLAGQPKSDFQTILKGYSGIDTAEVSLKPFWKMAFPSSPKDIKVTNTVLGK